MTQFDKRKTRKLGYVRYDWKNNWWVVKWDEDGVKKEDIYESEGDAVKFLSDKLSLPVNAIVVIRRKPNTGSIFFSNKNKNTHRPEGWYIRYKGLDKKMHDERVPNRVEGETILKEKLMQGEIGTITVDTSAITNLRDLRSQVIRLQVKIGELQALALLLSQELAKVEKGIEISINLDNRQIDRLT